MNTVYVNLKRMFFALFIATQILLAASISQAQPYQTINTQNSIVGGDLSRTLTTVQSGENPLNRFQITELKKVDVPTRATWPAKKEFFAPPSVRSPMGTEGL